MKRFYENAAGAPIEGGFVIELDGRGIKTPARNPLLIPNEPLADAIAKEWGAQGEEIEPATMPLTALAEGALDQVTNERERIVGRIAGFADSDMLYYRADESQPALTQHQTEKWDPLLDWARARYDVSFNLIRGILHQSQPKETLSRLTSAVEAEDGFTIAAMLSLVGLTGSLIATLALVEKSYDADTLWPLVNLEELWQEQQWGADDIAVKARAKKEVEFLSAALFLELARS